MSTLTQPPGLTNCICLVQANVSAKILGSPSMCSHRSVPGSSMRDLMSLLPPILKQPLDGRTCMISPWKSLEAAWTSRSEGWTNNITFSVPCICMRIMQSTAGQDIGVKICIGSCNFGGTTYKQRIYFSHLSHTNV